MAEDAPPGRKGSGVVAILRALLWLILVCCFACFMIITFMRPTTWYSSNQAFVDIRNNMTIAFPGDVPVATTTVVKNGKTVIQNVGRDAALWAGGSAFPVTLQVGSVMIAALAVAGLKYLASTHPVPLATPCTGGVLASCCGCFGSLARKVRCVLSYPLPPTRVWNWLCGGMSVMDALFVMIWVALNIVYLYFMITRSFDRISRTLMPPPAPAPALSPPPSPPAANSATPAATPRTVDLLTPLFMSQRFEAVADIAGQVTRFQMMLMFIPISRSHFLKWICGTDFPTLIKYHRWMSWFTISTILTHSVMYMMLWGAEASFAEELSWETTHSRRNVCGLIGAIAASIIALSSTSWFRKTYYWLFYKVHVFGFLFFTIFGMMHYKGLVNWILPGLFLYAVDRAFRYWQLAFNWTSLSPEDFAMNDQVMTLRLRWSKTSSIAPGQTLYLRCPSISLFQSHPFSVADIVTDNDSNCTHVIIHLTVKGPWTTAIRDRLLEGQTVKAQVEGPYETSLDTLPKTPVVVMVAGGIGATPMLSLLLQYVRMLKTGDQSSTVPLPKVHLLWSSRKLADLKLLGAELLTAASHGHLSPSSSLATKLSHTQKVLALPGSGRSSTEQAVPIPAALEPVDSCLNSTTHHAAGGVGGWLEAVLHYTGCELEMTASSVKVDLPQPTKRAGSTTSTPVRPLSLHPAHSPALYAVCILLGFFGAWSGLLAVNYYDGYWARTTADGANYLGVAVLLWTLNALGGVIPVLVTLAVYHLLLRFTGHGGTPGDVSSGGLSEFIQSSVTVLPGYILAPVDAPADSQHHGTRLPLVRGRPDVMALLQQVKCEYDHLSSVEVLVGGGDELCQATEAACAICNTTWGDKGPTLVCRRIAHHW